MSFPGTAGFSLGNVYRMRSFYLAYRAPSPIVAQAARQLDGDAPPESMASLPWFHNVVLLEQLGELKVRHWYGQQALTNGWSRSMLEHWIAPDLYARQGKAVTNFQTTLPAAQSDLARQVLKDPYDNGLAAHRLQSRWVFVFAASAIESASLIWRTVVEGGRMRVHWIVVGIAVLASGLMSQAMGDNLASGRGVQLDALNDRLGLLIVDEKRLYTLDLRSGKADLLVESRTMWFAADKGTATVLVATRADGGYELTLYSLKDDKLVVGTRQFMPVFVCDLQSAKVRQRPTFVVCGPVAFTGDPKGKAIPWVSVFVHPDERIPGTFARVPVPGMSDITSFMGSGTIGFAGDEKGTYAYTAAIAPESAASVKTLANAADVVDHAAFVVIREGRPVYAYPVRTPIQGRCLQFSDDGAWLLGHLGMITGRPASEEPWCKVINMKTGQMGNWSLGDADAVFAVDGTLKRAVVGDNVVKGAATAPAVNMGAMGLFVPGDQPQNEGPSEWQVQVRRHGRPPVVLPQLTQRTYDNEVAATYLDGVFWVTDGKRLFRIDANDEVTVMPIVGVAASGQAAER